MERKKTKSSTIIEKIYMSEKEASYRYCMSLAWFQRCRWAGNGPPYIKVHGSGRVLYSLKETDNWFESHTVETQAFKKASNEKNK